jgi:predicted nucleic acid-binding protein
VSRVSWDSMVFIYLLENNLEFAPQVKRMHKTMLRRDEIPCTSIFTLGEVLSGPRKKDDTAGIRGIKDFFSSDEVELIPFSSDVADRYSIIRSTSRTTQADAIHLASAAATDVDIFVTNDLDIRKLKIPGIKFLTDLEGKVF